MAHAKTTDYRDTLLYQCSRGFRGREVSTRKAIVALNRSDNTAPDRIMATAIKSETEVVPIFAAPCAARVLRIYANGTPFALMAAGGTVTATVYKAVIGGSDSALCSAVTVGQETAAPTADTAIDATLTGGTTMDLLEGQHVYVSIAVSAHDVLTNVAYISVNVEWAPTEQ